MKLNNALEDLGNLLTKRMNELRDEMSAAVTSVREALPQFDGFDKVPEGNKGEIEKIIKKFEGIINSSSSIASLLLHREKIEINLRTEVMQKIHDLQPVPPKPPTIPPVGDGTGPGIIPTPPVDPPKPPVRIIQLGNIKSDYRKPLITTPEQVNEYLESLKRKMIEEIEKGNQIIL
jgi:hypothetical protein